MSKIEWTDRTWNPTTGCNKISPGCKNCYALTMHKRLKGMGQIKYQKDFSAGVQIWEDELLKPFRWKKPAMVFVNSMSDLFHEDVPFDFIDKVFAVMVLSPRHTFQVLTKRADRMAEYFTADMKVLIDRWENATYEMGLADEHGDNDAPACSVYNLCEENAPKNVWLGASVENQHYAYMRIPFLMRCPAAVRFLSCEPLLDHVDFNFESIIETTSGYKKAEFNALRQHVRISDGFDDLVLIDSKIDWVIAGGESGHGARPLHPDWVRTLRNQCLDAGVAFFFKQWGEYAPHMDGPNVKKKSVIHKGIGYPMCKVGKKKAGRELDGRTWDEMPIHVDAVSRKLEKEVNK